MMKPLTFAAAAGLALAFATGCSSESSGSTGTTPCPTFVVAPPTLVSPANNATGVSINVGTIALSNAQTQENVLLTSPGNAAIAAGPVSPTSSTSENVSVSQLTAATTYSVVVTGIPKGCSSYTATIGSFST